MPQLASRRILGSHSCKADRALQRQKYNRQARPYDQWSDKVDSYNRRSHESWVHSLCLRWPILQDKVESNHNRLQKNCRLLWKECIEHSRFLELECGATKSWRFTETILPRVLQCHSRVVRESFSHQPNASPWRFCSGGQQFSTTCSN